MTTRLSVIFFSWSVLFFLGQRQHFVQASSSSSSPSWFLGRRWRINPRQRRHDSLLASTNFQLLNPRAQKYVTSRVLAPTRRASYDNYDDEQHQDNYFNPRYHYPTSKQQTSLISPPRGGQDSGAFVKAVGQVTNLMVQAGKLVLPPTVAATEFIVNFYRALPKDVILAQVGLVYCFAGGYYPTLFSSLQAAQQCGWNSMCASIGELAHEAIRVINVLDEHAEVKLGKRSLMETTSIVMATVDPVKINQAASALYTTWLGVSVVLEREYARVITLSLTMADYLERFAQIVFEPPALFVVPEKYHQWVPVVIGWLCKGAAMNIAWRIQRVMTAATSAVTGGLLFARACSRMLSRRGVRLLGLIPKEGEDHTKSVFDEILGFLVCGIGFYTQIESQWRSGFSFNVPFPISLVTWPFDFLEKWIQWEITK